ncbi:MAG: hypothetical protein PVJ82_07655, partial [Desulfobacteraceae bacterium]
MPEEMKPLSLQASKLPSLPVSKPLAMNYELSAVSYLPDTLDDTRNLFELKLMPTKLDDLQILALDC